MEIGFIVISLCAIFVMLQSVRAIVGRHAARRLRPARAGSAFDAALLGSGRCRLHWVDTAELSHLIASDPELVIFKLVEGDSGEDRQPGAYHNFSVTLNELERTMPWIPHSSRVALYRDGGLHASLLRRLTAIIGCRDVLLIHGVMPIDTADVFQDLAGELCN